jgi:glucokinase
MSVLAIDIGGTKFSIALFRRVRGAWTMSHRESRQTDREGGREWMLARIEEIGRGWAEEEEFESIGVGFGGPVNFERQQVVLSTHVGGWSDFDLPSWLRERFVVPVVMDNDANAGALGEGFFGAGQGARPMFYMTISTGIGGGILTEEGVYRGADSYAGEIGHLNVRPDGPECLCGSHGCLERMCCGLWLERDYGRPAKELLEDPEFVSHYVVDLARGLKAAVMLLNRLIVPLREELRRQVTSWSKARLEVEPASLGDDSVLWGALRLALKPAGSMK